MSPKGLFPPRSMVGAGRVVFYYSGLSKRHALLALGRCCMGPRARQEGVHLGRQAAIDPEGVQAEGSGVGNKWQTAPQGSEPR